jgi:predicted Zn-dependent protease
MPNRAIRRHAMVGLSALLFAAGMAAWPVPDNSTHASDAIELAAEGRCSEALPAIEHLMPHLQGQIRYNAWMAQARCAMALGRESPAIQALLALKREFPDDPEAMFIAVHYFSQLAQRNAQQLAAKAPNSIQARRLEAENFESQGKWDEAAGIYRGILSSSPKTPEIHYRLGQVLLAKAGDSGPIDEARSEFQKELAIDPHNAAAEFVLGELARRAAQWPDAAAHFGKAAKLDPGFSEAYLAEGMSLAAEGKFDQAVPSLERYVKMQPEDPAGHYQLAIAYGRTGNREGANREMQLKAKAAEAVQNNPALVQGHPVQ